MAYRYQTIETEKVGGIGKTFYQNVIYPDIPEVEGDNYVITVMGDRMDLMAQDFYGDTSYWWVIASANALPGDSLFPPIGMQLRIPVNLQSIINSYKQINTIR
jgi:hypothetical protein